MNDNVKTLKKFQRIYEDCFNKIENLIEKEINKNKVHNMNLKEYQKEAKRTNAPMPREYKYLTELHMLMGLTTEVGELTDVFKKNLAYGKEIDWVNVGEEVADVMWYLINFCDVANIDLGKELDKNIKKLKARFPEKFTTEKALTRDLETERKILES